MGIHPLEVEAVLEPHTTTLVRAPVHRRRVPFLAMELVMWLLKPAAEEEAAAVAAAEEEVVVVGAEMEVVMCPTGDLGPTADTVVEEVVSAAAEEEEEVAGAETVV